MKEYIGKQELINKIAKLPDDIDMLTIGRVIGVIDTQPTITKTDICWEFIDYVKFCKNTYINPQIVRHPEFYEGFKSAFIIFELMLKEMESE